MWERREYWEVKGNKALHVLDLRRLQLWKMQNGNTSPLHLVLTYNDHAETHETTEAIPSSQRNSSQAQHHMPVVSVLGRQEDHKLEPSRGLHNYRGSSLCKEGKEIQRWQRSKTTTLPHTKEYWALWVLRSKIHLGCTVKFGNSLESKVLSTKGKGSDGSCYLKELPTIRNHPFKI